MKKRVSWRSIMFATLLLVASLVVNYYATAYATESAGSPVPDIILSNIPVFDVDGSFVLGPIIFWLIMAYFMLLSPQKIPFTFDSLAALLLIRAGFITLTHIGPFPGHIIVERDFLGIFSTGGDLFFSGHTALPFLMALVYWDHFRIRIFCILSSIFFAIIVLLAHVHYSIDVAAAFFITFTVHHIATHAFKDDLALFKKDDRRFLAEMAR